ncbi:NUDIX hydrolase [Nocardioides sp. SYSU D00038]|uniref:NUDIX hydrolase n=1 Tax=Nocardioides sp. SYSU D00038 TaxID=2812554 RepID=UPI0019686657|nr:NUDIX domain-containing protein [Nocardioides sp. SYSU D00038]
MLDYTDYDTRLAAYAVVVDDAERVLLALWNEPAEPLWTLPGGGVDLGERVEDGCVREVREETGYDVALGRLLGVDTAVIEPGRRRVETARPLQAVRIFFEARVTGGTLTRELDGTTDEARWFPLAEVPDLPRVAMVDTALGLVGR